MYLSLDIRYFINFTFFYQDMFGLAGLPSTMSWRQAQGRLTHPGIRWKYLEPLKNYWNSCPVCKKSHGLMGLEEYNFCAFGHSQNTYTSFMSFLSLGFIFSIFTYASLKLIRLSKHIWDFTALFTLFQLLWTNGRRTMKNSLCYRTEKNSTHSLIHWSLSKMDVIKYHFSKGLPNRSTVHFQPIYMHFCPNFTFLCQI